MAQVFITGAGRGIGLELARQHALRGDDVVALVRRPDAAPELSALVDASDGRVAIYALDAADVSAIPDALAATGSKSVDLLYNVAGVAGPKAGELEGEIDWAAWDEAFDVMVKAPFAIVKALLPRMQDGSKVINFSSQLAASTWPTGGYYAYGAAKAGLNRMMRSVAVDVKDRGIVVASLHPGWVKTDMGGENADLTVEQSAQSIIALADRLTIAETGDFFKWNGERHAW